MERGEFSTLLNGLDIGYTVRGDGPVCAMVTPGRGWPDRGVYASTLAPLETRFTMVYVDTRGTGDSEAPSDDDGYLLDNFVSDLEALRDHLGQRAWWLAGHSSGGFLAARYALDHPNRCEGLLLLSPSLLSGMDLADTQGCLMKRAHEPWFADAIQAWFVEEPRVESDADLAAVLHRYLPLHFYDQSKREEFENRFGSCRAAALATDRVNAAEYQTGLLERLQGVSIPTVIVFGETEYVSPGNASLTHVALERSKLLFINRAGHFPWVEQPEQFFSLVGHALTAVSPTL